jgi:uncharacterized protein YhhL (DUF1145 family)
VVGAVFLLSFGERIMILFWRGMRNLFLPISTPAYLKQLVAERELALLHAQLDLCAARAAIAKWEAQLTVLHKEVLVVGEWPDTQPMTHEWLRGG